MKTYHMGDMKNGWFVGDFAPTAFRTSEAEVCFATHKAGENPQAHFHKEAPEITAVISGLIVMYNYTTHNIHMFGPGDIFVVEPNEIVEPIILRDTQVIVVKVPSLPKDKYYYDPDCT
ncbi:MAG: hypothetical protein KOO63_04065 [Bacteroidales bacterium]|nr:hypothetical protein [Candidatus Latescibacterota bacterium]